MTQRGSVVFKIGDREIYHREVEGIIEVTRLCRGLPRAELAHTVCEHLQWLTASGRHKTSACMKLLIKLDESGTIELPARRENMARGPRKKISHTNETAPQPEIRVGLSAIGPVKLQVASRSNEKKLWNEYVDRYHQLGYKQPFGYRMRYFIECPQGKLGCLLLTGAAKSMGVRDTWIGWSDETRLKNLAWIVNNSRYLVFPWVQVPHLASHALGHLARRVRDDWNEQFGYRPLLLETFVDPLHYQGTCYRAAGWHHLGQTTGEGLRRPGRKYKTTPKMLFVKPLVKNFREQLCAELKGREAVE